MENITAEDLRMTPEKAAAFFDAIEVVRNAVDCYTLGGHRTERSYAEGDRLRLHLATIGASVANWLVSDDLNLYGQKEYAERLAASSSPSTPNPASRARAAAISIVADAELRYERAAS